MKRLFWPLMALVVMLVVVPEVWAGNNNASGTNNGQDALNMATYLYCGAKGIMQGYIGLFIGLIVVAMGLWAMIQGKGMSAGLTLIIFGSLVTAFPSLIEQTLIGFGTLLKESQIATSEFQPATCAGTIPAPPDNSDIDPMNPNNLAVVKEFGQQLPKQENYEPAPFYGVP